MGMTLYFVGALGGFVLGWTIAWWVYVGRRVRPVVCPVCSAVVDVDGLRGIVPHLLVYHSNHHIAHLIDHAIQLDGG